VVVLCAVTFRDGNEIYTVDECDGINHQGFLYVGEMEDGHLDFTFEGFIPVNCFEMFPLSIICTCPINLKVLQHCHEFRIIVDTNVQLFRFRLFRVPQQ